MEQPTPDEKTPPSQTHSRTTLLELDHHTGELGRPKARVAARDEVNRKNALHKVLNQRTYITADLERVIYGSFNQKPATLIVFDFKFRFESDSRLRFKAAEIAISLKATPDGINKPLPKDDPVVYNFAPKKIYGNATVETQSWTYGVAVPCMASVGLIQAGIQPYVERSSSFEKGHRMEISGRGFKDTQHEEENEVLWTIKENGKEKGGIPDQLKFAIILGYNGRFQADIKVTAEADFKLKLFGWPWPKDDPVFFRPTEGFGMPVETPRWFPDLDTIRDDEWAEFIPRWMEGQVGQCCKIGYTLVITTESSIEQNGKHLINLPLNSFS